MNSIKTLLHEEIENEIEKIGDMELGTPEHAKAVESWSKLVNSANEINKTEASIAQAEQQMTDEKRSRLVGYGFRLLEIGAPLAMTWAGTKMVLKFEETGSITTTVGRQIIPKLFRSK
jgi:hypothetical protein